MFFTHPVIYIFPPVTFAAAPAPTHRGPLWPQKVNPCYFKVTRVTRLLRSTPSLTSRHLADPPIYYRLTMEEVPPYNTSALKFITQNCRRPLGHRTPSSTPSHPLSPADSEFAVRNGGRAGECAGDGHTARQPLTGDYCDTHLHIKNYKQ